MPRMTDARPLAGQPWLRAPASRKVLRALQAGGRPARFVGGCVRDGLLGRAGLRADLDLATPEPPEAVIRLLEAAGLKALPTGLAHGTVTTVVGSRRFEITTLRRDVVTDGRHALVAFTDDFEADAARRDFTINAMSCDADGRLYDYFGGRPISKPGRVRFVGAAAQRIAEDYLRILRFFRFFAHYGRPPADPEALAAAARAAPESPALGRAHPTEMLKLLEAPDPLPALRLMADSAVLSEVIRGPVAQGRLARLPGPGARGRPAAPPWRPAPAAARRSGRGRHGGRALAARQPGRGPARSDDRRAVAGARGVERGAPACAPSSRPRALCRSGPARGRRRARRCQPSACRRPRRGGRLAAAQAAARRRRPAGAGPRPRAAPRRHSGSDRGLVDRAGLRARPRRLPGLRPKLGHASARILVRRAEGVAVYRPPGYSVTSVQVASDRRPRSPPPPGPCRDRGPSRTPCPGG